jgi:hypothetical protein
MTTAGHCSMATTNRYLHLAGVVVHDEAQALAQRYNFVPASDDLREPEPVEGRMRTGDGNVDDGIENFILARRAARTVPAAPVP